MRIAERESPNAHHGFRNGLGRTGYLRRHHYLFRDICPSYAASGQGADQVLKGTVIAVLLLIGASLVDGYMTNGRYTGGVVAMVRQMRHSFGV